MDEQIRNLAHLLEKHQKILQTLHERVKVLEQVVRDIQTGINSPEQL